MNRVGMWLAYGTVVLWAATVAVASAPAAADEYRWRDLGRRAKQANQDIDQWNLDAEAVQRRAVLLDAHPAFQEYNRKVLALFAQLELEPKESPARQRLYDEFHASLTPTEWKLQEAYLSWRQHWETLQTRREVLQQTRGAILSEAQALQASEAQALRAQRERTREAEWALLDQQLRTLQTERALLFWESWQRQFQRSPRLECWARPGPLGTFMECR